MSFSLALLLLLAWEGWVSGAIGGPSKFLPNSQKVKSARTCFHIVTTIFNYTLDTREVVVIVEEEVMRVEGTMPSPSHFAALKLDGLRER